jgi:uncharacterized repeat protein (TIGR02543 family)
MKRKNQMRFLITALVPVFFLIAACKSPESPIPEAQEVPKDVETLPYDVTYFGNGSTAGEAPVDVSKYESGKDTVTVKGKGNLYRVGYRFGGWNTSADGTGKPFAEDGQFVMENNSVPLYAQWEEVYPKISAGEGFSTLLTKAGVLYAAGRNTSGRLGDGTNTGRDTFTPVVTTNITMPVREVSSGTDHSFAILAGGSIVGWGQGDYGKLGIDSDSASSYFPIPPAYSGLVGTNVLGEVRQVSAGRYQTAVLTKDGQYWAAGSKTAGALGNGEPAGAVNREKSLKYITGDVISIAAGWNSILLVKSDGSLWIAGEGGTGRLGTGYNANVTKLRKNTAIDQNNSMVFAGKTGHSMLLKKDGRILSTGQNNYGQLGNGSSSNQNQYFLAAVVDLNDAEMTDVAYAALGDTHSMILKKDGTLWAVGRNNDSQLGTGAVTNYLSKAVMVMDRVAHVAAGYNHSLAVRDDGTLWAAGSNGNKQFGGTVTQEKDTLENSSWVHIDISAIVTP